MYFFIISMDIFKSHDKKITLDYLIVARTQRYHTVIVLKVDTILLEGIT